jgi:APA family basic amino acid/polyamine antiporter
LREGTGSLDRSIRLPNAVALVVGTVVGSAIFVQPAEVARAAGSPAAALAAWGVAGALALAGALVCAELASSFRSGGGLLRYLTEAFGPTVGFLWAWTLFWTIHTAILGAVAVVFGRSVRALAPELPLSEKALAVAAILLCTWLNLAGIRRAAGVQGTLTALKVAALVALAASGLALGGPPAPPETLGAPPAESGGWSAAVIAALFAFGGWHLVTFPTDETAAPERTLPRALGIGMLAVMALYLALNLAYLAALPFQELASSGHVAAAAAAALAGEAGSRTMAAAAALSTAGALAGLVLAGPRVLHALGASGLAPAALASVEPRRRSPHVALALQAIWASVLVLLGSYRTLYGNALVVEWLFFALLGVAAIRLRGRGVRRAFSAPFHPILPALFSAGALALVAHRLLADPAGSGLGLLIAAAGLPAHWALRRGRTRSVPGWSGGAT